MIALVLQFLNESSSGFRHRRLSHVARRLLCIPLVAMCSSRSIAQSHYKVTYLGTLGGASYATDINEAGEVVGYCGTQFGGRGFIWTAAGGMEDIGPVGGGIQLGPELSINNHGQVSGTSDTGQAFIWDRVNGRRILGTLGGTVSGASGINDSGQVVGESYTLYCYVDGNGNLICQNGPAHAFLWHESTGMIDLGTLGGPTITGTSAGSVAMAINNMGEVTGIAATGTWAGNGGYYGHPFVWSYGQGMQDIWSPVIPNAWQVWPYDISDEGTVVGRAHVAFLWSSTTGMDDLCSITGCTSPSGAIAVDVHGRFVWAITIDWNNYYYLSTEDRQQELLPLNNGILFAMNNHGQIVGANGYYCDSCGAAVLISRCVEAHLHEDCVDASICSGGTAAFGVSATGDPLAYRWQARAQDGTWSDVGDGPLVDELGSTVAVISGSASASVAIAVNQSFASSADFREWRCRISNECSELLSRAALLMLCIADFDCSGFVDTDDFDAFVHAFEAGDDTADVDGSGFVDTDDFDFFVRAFEAGC
ncbi:MAG: hypothetical protein IT435_01510 [Phycisphaerales bacterium]|nr:hypothetical protein [Phycisphaerales bacterium]